MSTNMLQARMACAAQYIFTRLTHDIGSGRNEEVLKLTWPLFEGPLCTVIPFPQYMRLYHQARVSSSDLVGRQPQIANIECIRK